MYQELELIVEKRTRKLMASEKRYKLLVDNFPNGIVFLFNAMLQFHVVGREFVFSEQYLPVDSTKRRFEDIFSEIIQAKLKPLFERTLAGERDILELLYEGRYYLFQAEPVNFETEDHFGMVISQDVTDQKRAKIEIQELLMRMRELSELKKKFVRQVSREFCTLRLPY